MPKLSLSPSLSISPFKKNLRAPRGGGEFEKKTYIGIVNVEPVVGSGGGRGATPGFF